MKLAYPLSESIRIASLEAACPPALLAHPVAAMSTPQIQRCVALQELVKLMDSLGRGKGDLFTLCRSNGSEFLKASKLGERLLDLLFQLAPDVQQGSRNRRLDPRLHLAFESAFFHQIPLSLGRIQFNWLVESEPWTWAAILAGLVTRMRSVMAGKAFANGLERYRARDTTFLRSLSDYLKGLALAHPHSHVLRIELHWPSQHAVFDRRGVAARLHLALARWLELFRGSYGRALVGHAWQMQNDVDLFHQHVMLVLDGPSRSEFPALMDCAQSAWQAAAGPDGFVADCKRAGIQLKFRGSSVDASNVGLEQELANAGAYFAFANSLVTDDFDDLPPTRGYRSWPRVLPDLGARFQT